MKRILTGLSAAALALFMHATPASAAAVVNFVSATGNDANPCNVQANPCRTLQRAHNQTFQGGEVRVLSNLPAQITTINRSITVNGGGHTLIGPITINNAAAIVTIRDLHLTGRHASQHGISILRAVAVHIEKSTTERFVQFGIRVQPALANAMEVFVSDTVSRDNGDGLVVFGNANTKLTVDNSRIENNGSNGLYFDGGSASVSRSVTSGNGSGGGSGILIVAGTMNVTDTTSAGNAFGFALNGAGTEMTIVSSVARDNSSIGLSVVGAGMTARIAHSVFTNNVTGVSNGGTVQSLDIDPDPDVNPGDQVLRSNVIDGNTTDVSGNAITGLAGL
jgi:hypothetical protein